MKKTILLFSLFVLFIIPASVFAGPILRSGESISIDAGQSLSGDFYGLGQKITISGRSDDDVYLAGFDVTINAPVESDLTVIGGTVQIHADIGDDVRIVAGTVTIGGSVGGDVVVYSGALHVLSTAVIEGDIIYSGEDLKVEGEVFGAIHGLSENVRINSKVGGDISYTSTGTFSLGEKAEVLGSISYESNDPLARAQDAVVLGKIHQTELTSDSASGFLIAYLYFVGIFLFAILTLYFLNKKYLRMAVARSTESIGIDGLIGLGIFLVTPLVSIVLMVSIVGVLVGILLLLTYIIAIIVSVLLTAVVIGQQLLKLITKKSKVTIMTTVVGVVVFSIVMFIPVIGPLLIVAAIMVMLGGMVRSFYSKLRS